MHFTVFPISHYMISITYNDQKIKICLWLSNVGERLRLDLCRRCVNLLEEPDAANPQVRFCEGSSTTDVWLRWCGTAGKPGGNGEHKHRPTASEETDLLDSIKSVAMAPQVFPLN